MCQRIRSRIGCGRQIVTILAAIAVCSASDSRSEDESHAGDDAFVSESSGNLGKVKEGVGPLENLHVLDATMEALRGKMDGFRAPATGSECDHWADHRARAGIMVPMPGAVRLFVGEHKDGPRETGDFSVGNVQRNTG